MPAACPRRSFSLLTISTPLPPPSCTRTAAPRFQYGPTEGYLPLRKQIADRLAAKNGIHTDADHIMITAGDQQGLDYCARLFLNPGDVVVMESPSYLGAISAFKPCQPKFVEVPTDDGGMIMEELDRILATTENVKMIYVIPDFQNPSGRTWSLERRKAFMEVVNKYEVPVIEDNPYGELRFKGEFLPALKTMDTKDLVIYLGTFSKILAPGYRLGWICLRFRYIRQDDAHRAGRRSSDRHHLHDGRLQNTSICSISTRMSRRSAIHTVTARPDDLDHG